MILTNGTWRPISGVEEEGLREFARFLSRRLSPASVAAYQSDIRIFLESTPEVQFLRITEAQEDEYIATLHRMGRKKRTIQRKAKAFSYFSEFLAQSPIRNVASCSQQPPQESLTNLMNAGRRLQFNRKNPIDRSLRYFLRSLEKSRSHSTVRAYSSDLLKLRSYLFDKQSWQCVSKQLISDFINAQIVSGLNANSAARLLSVLRSLFQWLQQNGYVLGNPTLGLSIPRAQQHFHLPPAGEFESTGFPSAPSFKSLRADLIVQLLYAHGLRVSEIVALDISSIENALARLMVRNNRGRVRYVNLMPSTLKALNGYLSFRNDIAIRTVGPLLVNSRGERLTTRSIGRIVAEIAAGGRLPENSQPRSLRRAFANRSLASGKEVFAVRHELGVSGVSAAVKVHS